MNFNLASFETSYGLFSQIPPCTGIEIAFAGRSNVGKSTLINKIMNRKALARVSAVPGKTATINFYKVEPVRIVDLPGYGYAKVAKTEKHRWADLIEGYLDSDRDIRLIFLLIDMRHPPSKDDLHMIDYLIERELPFVIILTKADKLKPTERKRRMEAFKEEIPYFEEIHVVPFSSITREGIDEIRSIITDIAENSDENER
ncbi:MAG: ribosome biogenesis GTP-binding protein YihA/YsxC [Oscillospiraceae bacterium]|nr:ribosome biogenesis GTP-binding protein YihA/YsxC [Oscillospiraceae bacterium]